MPKLFTVFGIVIESRPEQYANVKSGSVARPLPMVTEVKPLQEEKT